MKIINKILIITGIIISTLACTNENHNERESIEMNSDIKKYKLSEVYNPENPYDEYAAGIESFFFNLSEVLNRTNEETPYSVFEDEIQEIINSHNLNYPAINSSNYSEEDEIYFNDFVKDYLKDASDNGIVEASLMSEINILSSDDEYIKDHVYIRSDLLCFISQIKFNFYYLEEIIIYYAPNYDERHSNCIGNHLNDIYNDNLAAQIIFVATLPSSFLSIVAECAYLAAFKPNHPDCQNGWMN